jgi:hypothetical protein
MLALVSPRKTLQPALIAETTALLVRRAEERFPGSGLREVLGELEAVAGQAGDRGDSLGRPLLIFRAAVWALAMLLASGLWYVLSRTRPATPTASSLADLLQGADAAVNIVLLLGAAIVSLWKLEESIRRRRALGLLHELRALAHVLDMHQLTKDPEALLAPVPQTPSSPRRNMKAAELGRYLDYCSEGLSLIGKIAAVYSQNVRDPVVLDAVDGIEDLTTGLSRKIWQKIAIIQDVRSIAKPGA